MSSEFAAPASENEDSKLKTQNSKLAGSEQRAATLSTLLAHLRGAAAVVESGEVAELADAIGELGVVPRLQLLIVGPTGSGRASIANIMLEQPDALPASPIPKAPVGIGVHYGLWPAAELVHGEATRTMLPRADLRSILTAPAGSPGQRRGGGPPGYPLGASAAAAGPVSPGTVGDATAAHPAGSGHDGDAPESSVEIQLPADLLHTCDLRIEAIEAERSAGEWQEVLSSADFVLLVLNATALLNDLQRRFIRERLAPVVGLERVAILLNQMDLVPEEEQESLLDLVRAFLGPFEAQPAIIPFSAARAAATLEDASDPGYDQLMTLIDDLLQQHAPLRAGALRQALAAAIDRLEAVARERGALYALDEGEVARLQATIASRREWLQERIARAQRRVEAFVETILREDLLRQTEAFGETFRRRLPDEVLSIEDIGEIRRYLPGYIETVWTEFLRARMIALRSALAGEVERINQLIASDLREMVAGEDGETPQLLEELQAEPRAPHIYVPPRRGQSRAANIARGLGIHGFVMLLFAPEIGVLSLAASQVVQRMYHSDISRADKQAIADAGIAASRDLEREVKARINERFRELAQELRGDIATTYEQSIKQITDALAARTAEQETLQSRREAIERVLEETIPALRSTEV